MTRREVLGIRCQSRETIRVFKVWAAGYESYEDALLALLERVGLKPQETVRRIRG